MKKSLTLKQLKVESFVTNYTQDQAGKNRGGTNMDNTEAFKCTFYCSGNPACY